MVFEIGALAFLGIVSSLFTQWLKNKMGTNEWGALATIALVSLVLAIAYWFVQKTGLIEALGTILLWAGAFYTFVVERFKK